MLGRLTPPLPLLLVLLEFLDDPMALLDCWQRPPSTSRRRGRPPERTRWLIVAVITVPILLGYGIVLGYYSRSSAGTPAWPGRLP